MAKELLLYSGIYSFVAEDLIKEIEQFKEEAINLRINSGGGSVQDTWGLCAKVTEHGDVKMKVDGVAFSSAANLTMYAKEVECLDVTMFMFHRAAYSYGGDSPEEKAFLVKVNSDLQRKMESRIDSAKLKEMKGMTVADLFEGEERKMLFLSASEAKKLGIVSKVNKLEPSEVKAFNETFLRIAAEHTPNQNSNSMTLAELKEKHPSIYAEAIALGRVEGVKAGIEQENDRIGAIMVFAHIDPKGVQEIIKSGKPMTQTQMSEFVLKANSPEVLARIKADSAAAAVVKTDEVKGEGKNMELESFEKGVRAELGLEKTEKNGMTLVQQKN